MSRDIEFQTDTAKTESEKDAGSPVTVCAKLSGSTNLQNCAVWLNL